MILIFQNLKLEQIVGKLDTESHDIREKQIDDDRLQAMDEVFGDLTNIFNNRSAWCRFVRQTGVRLFRSNNTSLIFFILCVL